MTSRPLIDFMENVYQTANLNARLFFLNALVSLFIDTLIIFSLNFICHKTWNKTVFEQTARCFVEHEA